MLVIKNSSRYWLDFLLAMTEKEIKARYKRAILGFLWILINPLLQMLVMGLVFQFFVPVPVDNYFLFLFAGLLPWNFFAQSVTKSTPAFFYERNLIKKAKFPREAIVFSIVLANFFHFFVSLLLLIIILVGNKIIFDGYNLLAVFHYLLMMWPLFPSIILLLFLTLFFSLLMASLNVRFRDVNFMVQLGVNLWFYATPVVYVLRLLPETFQPLFYLNPMTVIVELFHLALLNQNPALGYFMPVAAIMVLLIIYLAIYFFKKENKNFDDWL